VIIDSLIADEFSGELGEGLAYVAGHDDDARPVVVQYFDLILSLLYKLQFVPLSILLFFLIK
jgi:hypothetical protein